MWSGTVDIYHNKPDWDQAMTDTSAGMQSLAKSWKKNPCCIGRVKVYDVDSPSGKVTEVTIDKD